MGTGRIGLGGKAAAIGPGMTVLGAVAVGLAWLAIPVAASPAGQVQPPPRNGGVHLVQGMPSSKPAPLGGTGSYRPAPQPGPSAPSLQGDGLPSMPEPHGTNLRRSIAPSPTPLTGDSLDFFGGVAITFGERRCGVSLSTSELADFAAFGQAAISRVGIGSNFGAPDIRDAMRDQARSQAATMAGAAFARQVPCPSGEATAIIRALLRGMRQATASGGNTFVESCSTGSRFNRAQCECIARVGMGAIPDIHGLPYRRELMAQISQRNPFVTMQLVMQCQVMNY